MTKALVPPFLVIFLAIYTVREVVRWWRSRRDPTKGPEALRRFAWRMVFGGVMGVCFLAVVYPYIANSQRVFGQYLFNQNTTFYIWYDSGAEARAVMLPHTDDEGRVSLPVEQLPSPGQVLEHAHVRTDVRSGPRGHSEHERRSIQPARDLPVACALYRSLQRVCACRDRLQLERLSPG